MRGSGDLQVKNCVKTYGAQQNAYYKIANYALYIVHVYAYVYVHLYVCAINYLREVIHHSEEAIIQYSEDLVELLQSSSQQVHTFVFWYVLANLIDDIHQNVSQPAGNLWSLGRVFL